MPRKSVSKKEESTLEGKEFKDSIESLLKVLLEEMEEEYFNEVEPFESYSKRVRLKLTKDIHDYCKRFLNGYQEIMKEIEKDK